MNLHPMGSEAGVLVKHSLKAADSLRRLKQLLGTGQIGIHDEFLEKDTFFRGRISSHTLLDVSVHISFLTNIHY